MLINVGKFFLFYEYTSKFWKAGNNTSHNNKKKFTFITDDNMVLCGLIMSQGEVCVRPSGALFVPTLLHLY